MPKTYSRSLSTVPLKLKAGELRAAIDAVVHRSFSSDVPVIRTEVNGLLADGTTVHHAEPDTSPLQEVVSLPKSGGVRWQLIAWLKSNIDNDLNISCWSGTEVRIQVSSTDPVRVSAVLEELDRRLVKREAPPSAPSILPPEAVTSVVNEVAAKIADIQQVRASATLESDGVKAAHVSGKWGVAAAIIAGLFAVVAAFIALR